MFKQQALGTVNAVPCLLCGKSPKVFMPQSYDDFTKEHMRCPECGRAGLWHASPAGVTKTIVQIAVALQEIRERLDVLEQSGDE